MRSEAKRDLATHPDTATPRFVAVPSTYSLASAAGFNAQPAAIEARRASKGVCRCNYYSTRSASTPLAELTKSTGLPSISTVARPVTCSP